MFTNSLSYKSDDDSDFSSLSMSCKEVSKIPQMQQLMFEMHINPQETLKEEFSLSDTSSESELPEENNLKQSQTDDQLDTISRVSSFSNLNSKTNLRKKTLNTRISINSEGNKFTCDLKKSTNIIQEKVSGKEKGRKFSGLFFRQNSQNVKTNHNDIDWVYFANLDNKNYIFPSKIDTKLAGVKAVSLKCIPRRVSSV